MTRSQLWGLVHSYSATVPFAVMVRVEHGEGMMRKGRGCDRDREHGAKAESCKLHRDLLSCWPDENATPPQENKSKDNYTAGRGLLTNADE
jgi:hypothetical protein